MKNHSTMLILSVNVLLNLIVVFYLKGALDSINAMNVLSAWRKPLFHKLTEIYMDFLLPAGIISFLILYFLYGSQIIQLLDYYHLVYNCVPMKIVSIFLVLIFHYIFISENIDSYLNIEIWSNTIDAFMKLATLYIIIIPDYLTLIIVAYYKYGTYSIMKDIHRELIRNLPKIQLYEIFIYKQVRLLAGQNRKLNQMISLFLFNFFLINCASFIITFTVISLEMENAIFYGYFSYMAILFSGLIYSIHISMKINQTLKMICQLLLRYQWKINSQFGKYKLTPNSKCPGQVLYQMKLYRNDFDLNLFDCVKLDYEFLLNFVVFIISNVTIIIQTEF